MSNLEPFDEESVCPKCGYEDLTIRTTSDGRFIERTCGRCSWKWNEIPLDQVAPKDECDCPECAEAKSHPSQSKSPTLEDIRRESQQVLVGRGFEVRVIQDPTPEMLEVIKNSSGVIGIPIVL